MARVGTRILDNGDRFPPLRMQAAGGGEVVLPDDLLDHWSVVLFYRGHF